MGIFVGIEHITDAEFVDGEDKVIGGAGDVERALGLQPSPNVNEITYLPWATNFGKNPPCGWVIFLGIY